jgi:hypothetical protein
MIGQSNRQTLPQSASMCFQRFMLPQCANLASLCRRIEPVGYNLGYKSAGRALSYFRTSQSDNDSPSAQQDTRGRDQSKQERAVTMKHRCDKHICLGASLAKPLGKVGRYARQMRYFANDGGETEFV